MSLKKRIECSFQNKRVFENRRKEILGMAKSTSVNLDAKSANSGSGTTSG